ncbi:isoleucine-tRNA ligase [Lichtheimia ornata]|uniref:isoleucine--tRNA ligase n=1 Tax=Lichtheimia ornata TaxID=688661 RepID=A0AAD7V2R9_9FUNG|nr:isoleucine-tRNA ligase [Lichtheimia ornata]KAJ8658278.1 isoleucine-tRNA ligase [Lichtheimia ornata]
MASLGASLSRSWRGSARSASATTRSLSSTATLLAKPKNPYTDTLLLPKTPFPLRANAVSREHLFKDRCTSELYEWQLKNNPKELFVLHDGPPYANGDVHLGHALNKILKDIVNRYKMIQGHKVWYRPGWDCHGLPIELKALEAIRESGTKLSAVEIRQLAKKRALSEIEKQKKDFKSWGVIGDWNNPYQTLTKDYEIRQLRVFHDMIKRGYIYRRLKPVYWSPSSRSALAEAELEYNEQHVSRSIHVRFPITGLSSALEQKWKNMGDIHAVIWTTTPWTLPANKAISINPALNYSLIRIAQGGNNHLYIIGADRVEAFAEEIEADSFEILDQVSGSDLIGTSYTHPLWKTEMPLIGGDHVTADSGTGLVHTAPGHGMEDYEVCQKLGIEPFSPVDDQGFYTNEAGPQFAGKEAFSEGASAVIEALENGSFLVKQCDYVHKYPYDWRTKKPVMLRATAQWFTNVEDLQKEAVKALKNVKMVPDVSIRRLEQFTLSRKEWCISRQRAWGVPIPALYDVETGEPLLTDSSVEHIIKVFNERGTDCWWEEADDTIFVAPEYRNNGKVYKRGYDTMDVWYDSGTSWTMIKEYTGRDGKDKPLADVYLEGSDQHRGWFQSSLLTSIAVTGNTPYGTLITHGFTLDEQGRKMSKSIGNTIVPSVITHGGKDKKLWPAYGTDVLRMWVASCEYTRDVSLGPSIIAQVSDSIRKIRTTARFLLGNLHDFSYNDCVPYSDLKDIDKYMLHEVVQFSKRVTQAYDDYTFNRATQHIQNFTTNDLSAFYFDVIKDRLYNEQPNSPSRRSAQTVLYHVLRAYTSSFAPFACHTAEEIYENYKAMTPQPETSVFKQGWFALEPQWHNAELENKWSVLKQLKAQVNQVLELARQDKVIRSSQEADVDLVIDGKSPAGSLIHAMNPDELSSLFLTSRVHLHDVGTDISGRFEQGTELGSEQTPCRIVARASSQHKCPRCWNYHAHEADTLCPRCTNVLQQ